MVLKLTELFQSMWNKRKVPQQLKDASKVHIYKRKGNRQSCDNHRGISLLPIAGKILAVCSTVSINTLSRVSFQKASAVSMLDVELST